MTTKRSPKRAKPIPKPKADDLRVIQAAMSPEAAHILLDVFDKIELTGRPDEIVNALYEDIAEQLRQ